MQLRCGEIFNIHAIASCPQSVPVKKFENLSIFGTVMDNHKVERSLRHSLRLIDQLLHQSIHKLINLAHSFRGKFCQIPWASLHNSAAYCGKIVQIPPLTAAFHLWVN